MHLKDFNINLTFGSRIEKFEFEATAPCLCQKRHYPFRANFGYHRVFLFNSVLLEASFSIDFNLKGANLILVCAIKSSKSINKCWGKIFEY